MIIAKLIGGLGNQMFQYAAGRSLAHIRNTTLKLDTSFLETDPGGAYTKREFELSVFNFAPSLASTAEIAPFKKIADNRYRRALYRRFPSLFSKAYISENSALFQPAFFNFPANTYLDGFWQSEKYFKGIKEILYHDLTFKTPPEGLNLDLYKKIKTTNAVSLHVRRGDYVTHQNASAYHGTCSPDYYRKGVELIKQKHNDIELFIFSDEPDWCRQHLIFDLPCTYISHNKGKQSFEDLRLMSLCKHNIIANSSFSWWGSWLNHNPVKMVIAPKYWYANPNQKTDIHPENCITL